MGIERIYELPSKFLKGDYTGVIEGITMELILQLI